MRFLRFAWVCPLHQCSPIFLGSRTIWLWKYIWRGLYIEGIYFVDLLQRFCIKNMFKSRISLDMPVENLILFFNKNHIITASAVFSKKKKSWHRKKCTIFFVRNKLFCLKNQLFRGSLLLTLRTTGWRPMLYIVGWPSLLNFCNFSWNIATFSKSRCKSFRVWK